MKFIITILILANSLQFACTSPKASDKVSKQSNYVISGKISGIEGGKKLYLYNKENNSYTDSCLIQNGEFSLNGQQNDPVKARLLINNKNDRTKLKSLSFYLENADYRLITTFDNFENAQLEGNSKANKDFMNHKNTVGKVNDELLSLSRLLIKLESDGEDTEKTEKLYNTTLDKYRAIRKKYVHENLNTYPALDILLDYLQINEQLKKFEYLRDVMQPEMSDDELKACYQKLFTEMKNSSKGKALYNSLYFPDLMQGDQYVELEDTYTMDGKAFKIADIETDYVLLDFTGIYCGACKKFNKQMKPEYDKIKDKLTIVAFYTDADKEVIIKSTQKENIKWVVVSDFKGRNSPNMKRYKVNGIPDFYLLDKDRKIIEHKVGASDDFITYLVDLK